MSSNEQLEDPIIKLLEKALLDCVAGFETDHGIKVAYTKFEMLRQDTGEGVSHEANLDARIEIIV